MGERSNFGMTWHTIPIRVLFAVVVFWLLPNVAMAEEDSFPNTAKPGENKTGSKQQSDDAKAPSDNSEETSPATEPPAKTQGPTLTKAPKVKTFVEAQYPEKAKTDKIAGDVILAITINLDGSVSDPEVVQTLTPELDAAALEAVKQFVFEPAEFDNKPAVVRIQYRYTFTLAEEVVETVAPSQGAEKTGRLTGLLFEKRNKNPIGRYRSESNWAR
ncbi:MAG: energy transducer TonB, partial [Bradymonadia bacterium]